MTTAELRRIAAEILPPVGASVAIAMVDHEPGELLSNGYPSGVGGRTTFRAGFLVNGRQRVAIGPSFDDGRTALRLVRILNGEPASRPGPQTTTLAHRRAVDGETPSTEVRTEAPGSLVETPSPAGAMAGSIPATGTGASLTCAVCGEPIPPGRRGQRRATCSPACRVAAHRRRQAEAAGVGHLAQTRSVTPSRAIQPDDLDTHQRPGAEPQGVAPAQAADSLGVTGVPPDVLSDRDPAETGRAIANGATPGRSHPAVPTRPVSDPPRALARSAHPTAAPVEGQRAGDLTLGLRTG